MVKAPLFQVESCIDTAINLFDLAQIIQRKIPRLSRASHSYTSVHTFIRIFLYIYEDMIKPNASEII